MLGAILLSWLLVFLGWNFGLKWWRNRGEEKPKKPIKRPGLVLGCGMLIFFVSSQVFWSEWFWTQASQLTTINLAGIGRWEESLWNALGKASIVKKLRLPIGGERSTEGGIASHSGSDDTATDNYQVKGTSSKLSKIPQFTSSNFYQFTTQLRARSTARLQPA